MHKELALKELGSENDQKDIFLKNDILRTLFYAMPYQELNSEK
jgi:hypothetical protein